MEMVGVGKHDLRRRWQCNSETARGGGPGHHPRPVFSNPGSCLMAAAISTVHALGFAAEIRCLGSWRGAYCAVDRTCYDPS